MLSIHLGALLLGGLTLGCVNKDKDGGTDPTAEVSVSLDAEKASVRAGTLVLFDDSADDWRLWRVADDDLVHAESAPEPNRWETDYGEQPAMHYDQIQGHRKVITLDLTPGEYFLADWTAGKFNRIKRGADRFSGRWVHVAEK